MRIRPCAQHEQLCAGLIIRMLSSASHKPQLDSGHATAHLQPHGLSTLRKQRRHAACRRCQRLPCLTALLVMMSRSALGRAQTACKRERGPHFIRAEILTEDHQ